MSIAIGFMLMMTLTIAAIASDIFRGTSYRMYISIVFGGLFIILFLTVGWLAILGSI